MKSLSPLGLNPPMSSTREFDQRARKQAEKGMVLFFTLGEPDFPSPSNVKRAGTRAIKDNHTKYTDFRGMLSLREAICNRFKEDSGLVYSPEEVLVSVGAVASLYLALQCLVGKGDEVIVLSPHWPVYVGQIAIAGATPVFCNTTSPDFLPTKQQLESLVTPRTKAIMFNSPSNPTGAVYDTKTLEAIADVAKRHDLWVISDEIYEKLIYNKRHTSIASLPGMHERTVVINGVAKAYSMTGWRIGYAAGPLAVIKSMGSLQTHVTANPTSIAQHAALEALAGSQSSVAKMRREFKNRRDLIVKMLNEIPGITCSTPSGAFYAFPDVSGLFGKTRANGKTITNSIDVFDFFLEEAGVACVPGSPFGADNCVRFSYACSQEQIKQGMEQLSKAVSELK